VFSDVFQGVTIMRLLSVLLLSGLSLFSLPAFAYLQGLCEQSPENPTLVLGLLAAALVAAGYWSVMRGRTAIDGQEIRHSGLPPRRVALADIAQIKLVRLRGLEWLVTPRLVVQARGLGSSSFHCADAGVLDAFEQLCYGRPPAPRADA
jgi:hypothetical protein